MHEAVQSMLAKYPCVTQTDHVNALREILQELALLGLWRSKFFEHAAFYGGSALRVLHGLDRFSEDLDFSLLSPKPDFSLRPYGQALVKEIRSFGFEVSFDARTRDGQGVIESAFLKANTYRQLFVIHVDPDLLQSFPRGSTLKIKLEVDTDPPPGFETESRYLLLPIPFQIRSYTLPDLFAGKIHAVLCRRWKTRVKGRDWYDLSWYLGRHPQVRLSHLEMRMRQSGDYGENRALDRERLIHLLTKAIERLDVDAARSEVAPFVRDKTALEVWSQDFFTQIIDRLEGV